MRTVFDKAHQRVELIPESRGERKTLDDQFGPWETTPDPGGLRGPTGDGFEMLYCRREGDGAILIEVAMAAVDADLPQEAEGLGLGEATSRRIVDEGTGSGWGGFFFRR